jgi:hypothetical protein
MNCLKAGTGSTRTVVHVVHVPAVQPSARSTGPGGGAHALEGVLFTPHDGLHPEARGIKALSLELTRARGKRGARRRVMLYALERIRVCFRAWCRCEGGKRGVGQ